MKQIAQYRTVDGQITAADTLTGLTTFGGETSVGPVKVPAKVSKLVEIMVWIGTNVDTSADQFACILRLAGKGMKDGDQDFAVGAGGISTATIASVTVNPTFFYLRTDINVEPNETIAVQASLVGDAVTSEWAVTLVFA